MNGLYEAMDELQVPGDHRPVYSPELTKSNEVALSTPIQDFNPFKTVIVRNAPQVSNQTSINREILSIPRVV